MCCRLRLDLGELDRRGGGLFGANALTGSVGVVTINMPRLGYLAKQHSGRQTRQKRRNSFYARSPRRWTSRKRASR